MHTGLTVKKPTLSVDGSSGAGAGAGASGGGGGGGGGETSVVLRRLGALDGSTNLGSDVVQLALQRNIRRIRTETTTEVTYVCGLPALLCC
jgi:hypothetical protein